MAVLECIKPGAKLGQIILAVALPDKSYRKVIKECESLPL